MPWLVFVVPLVGVIDLTIAYFVATRIVPRKIQKSGDDVFAEVRHQGEALDARMTAAITAAVTAWQALQAQDKKEGE